MVAGLLEAWRAVLSFITGSQQSAHASERTSGDQAALMSAARELGQILEEQVQGADDNTAQALYGELLPGGAGRGAVVDQFLWRA